MPELPEVETIVRDLRDKIAGQTITSVDLIRPSIWRSGPPRKKSLINTVINAVIRKGKNILIPLSNNFTLIFHLKMTGRLTVESKDAPIPKHTHLIFNFGDRQLRFNDVRRFGYADLAPSDKLAEIEYLKKIGPDPFELSRAMFIDLIRSKNRMIKPLLMDQSIIAGIGNIYSDEALFLAGIHPRRISSRIKIDKLEKLYNSTLRVLQNSIKSRGTSVSDYVDASGQKGTFQNSLRVYGREGEPCKKCRRKIKRETIGSRSAHFCPGRQRLN